MKWSKYIESDTYLYITQVPKKKKKNLRDCVRDHKVGDTRCVCVACDTSSKPLNKSKFRGKLQHNAFKINTMSSKCVLYTYFLRMRTENRAQETGQQRCYSAARKK